MNTNQINEVINTLCDKFGIAAQNIAQLTPKYAKYEIVTDVVMIAFMAVVMALAVVIFKIGVKEEKNKLTMFDDGGFVFFIISGFMALCALVLIALATTDMVEWIITPEVKMIKEILGMIAK